MVVLAGLQGVPRRAKHAAHKPAKGSGLASQVFAARRRILGAETQIFGTGIHLRHPTQPAVISIARAQKARYLHTGQEPISRK
jgi:hypothetical protein